MTPQERAGFAAAVNEAIAQAVGEVRREVETIARSLQERADRAEALAGQLQRDLAAARDELAEPAIRTVLMDADGVLHIVQRGGPPLSLRLVDLEDMMNAALSDAMTEAEPRLRAELQAHVARALQRLGDAPAWTRMAVYGPGAVVSCYVGRTYVLRDGIAASMAQEPGEHPDVWERIGSHGLRVMKSKPAQLEAGDVFTDGESRFIHDGQTTTLLVQRMLKQSDLDRMFKPLQAELRAKRNGGTE